MRAGMVRGMDFQELITTAQLAQLELSKEEITRLGEEITHILEYFVKMDKIEVDTLEPTTHSMQKTNKTRSDQEAGSALADEILDNAPEICNRFITIPRIL
jgi:aspartyl/glutamyl-tRNA(Asn/Gln) amidotransferase C subunit